MSVGIGRRSPSLHFLYVWKSTPPRRNARTGVLDLEPNAHSSFAASIRDGGRYPTPPFANLSRIENVHVNCQPFSMSNWDAWAMLSPFIGATSLFRFDGMLSRETSCRRNERSGFTWFHNARSADVQMRGIEVT